MKQDANRGCSRPPLERMALISRWLREGRRLTRNLVAAELEVDAKTIERDIDFMRDRLGYQIDWIMVGPKEDWSYRGQPPKERVL